MKKCIRNAIPLKLRILVGPYIHYIVYLFSIYIRRDKKCPHVLSLEETINLIKEKKLSAIRFGDGEMSLIKNENLGFQKSNTILAKRIENILQIDNPKLLICVPGIWQSLSHFSKESFWFTLHHLFKYGNSWNELLNLKQVYGDAFITRPYLVFKDRDRSQKIFEMMKDIWNNEEVILIEGEKSRLGVGNDLFANVTSLKRILCPSENAFDVYDQIRSVATKMDTDSLILLSVGPTAKVLAYDLFLLGYRVIDIGHIDMEYEMFLRKEKKLTKVSYKYFNEINERNPEECLDKEYINQIIAKIE